MPDYISVYRAAVLSARLADEGKDPTTAGVDAVVNEALEAAARACEDWFEVGEYFFDAPKKIRSMKREG